MKTRKLALTEGITAGVLFGTAAIFIRFLDDVDVFSIAFWRLIIACIFILTISLLFRKSFDLGAARKSAKQLFVLGVFLALHFIFFVSAVKDTTILNATVLVNTTPIFSTFVSTFLFKTKPSRIAVLGLTISFIGVCVITYADAILVNADVQMQSFSPSLKGDLEAVLAALVEAFYLNYGRKVRGQMTVLPTMFHIYVVAAILSVVIGLSTTNQALTIPREGMAILALAGLGILPTAAAHTLYFSSLSSLKSFETATMALLEPIGATLLGTILFQERPAPLFVLGAILVLLGIVFVVKERS